MRSLVAMIPAPWHSPLPHDAGESDPLHKETNRHDDYREDYCGLNYIRQCHVLHLRFIRGNSFDRTFGFTSYRATMACPNASRFPSGANTSSSRWP